MNVVQIRNYIDQDFSQIVGLMFDFQNLIGIVGKQSGKKNI